MKRRQRICLLQCVIGIIIFKDRQQSKMDACLPETLPLVSVAERDREWKSEIMVRNGDRHTPPPVVMDI